MTMTKKTQGLDIVAGNDQTGTVRTWQASHLHLKRQKLSWIPLRSGPVVPEFDRTFFWQAWRVEKLRKETTPGEGKGNREAADTLILSLTKHGRVQTGSTGRSHSYQTGLRAGLPTAAGSLTRDKISRRN
jgi:hypothetical protein